MSNEQKQKLKDYRKEYYVEKKLKNNSSVNDIFVFNKHKNNIVVLLTLGKSKNIVLLLTLDKSKKM